MAANQATTLLFLYGETALHPGTGASIGTVDLPVQRERTTHYPMIQASSIKGVLRAMAKEKKTNDLNLIFGPEMQEYAGAISFSDAKILLFPVRSLMGVFAWITCPAILSRLQRDLLLTDSKFNAWDAKDFSLISEDRKVLVPTEANTISSDRVVLEEFIFTPEKNEKVAKIAGWLADNTFPNDFKWWQDKVRKSLVVLADEDFRDFVTTATEITARTKLNPETKTVDTKIGALWYQEFLPAETLFYSLVLAQRGRNNNGNSPDADAVLKSFTNLSNDIKRIQIGGDETTGKGFCTLRTL